MNCDECREKLVEYIEGLLTQKQHLHLAAHIEDCQSCRMELDALTALNQRIASNAETARLIDLECSILNRIASEQERKPKHTAGTHHRLLRRFVMKTPLKLTAAAIIAVFAILSLTLSEKMVAPAYAIEQTIEAFHSVTSIHAKIYYPINSEPALLWAEFDKGQAKRLRASQPAFDPHDGPKEIVWQENVAQVWSKKTNVLYYIRSAEGIKRIEDLFYNLDPKFLVQKLEMLQQEGTADITIEQPSDIGEPIVITATLTHDDMFLGRQVIVMVDQATKLVTSLQTVKGDGTLSHKNGHFGMEDFHQIEFYDYNQPVDDSIFNLIIPEDVTVIDRASRLVGLSHHAGTIEDTAVKVVKTFWQSLVESDFETAASMYGGVPAAKLKESFDGWSAGRIVRVVSVSNPVIHPNPEYIGKAFVVESLLEVEKSGHYQQKSTRLVVKEVDGQPGQWAICGEI